LANAAALAAASFFTLGVGVSPARCSSDPEVREPRRAKGFAARARARCGRETAGIRDDPGFSAAPPERHERADDLDEIARVAGLRIFRALDRHDRERDLGEVVEREKIELGLGGYQARRRIRLVAPEGGGVGDAESH
jgi:hypothetical protein